MSNVIERYASSVNSSNLRDDERHSSTAILAAVALSNSVGNLLFRVKYASDKGSLPELILIWRDKVAKKAMERGWAKHARVVADESLLYFLNDMCVTCEGRGHPKIINAPTLEACVCQACNGTTKRKLQVAPELRDYVLDALEQLSGMEREAGAAAMRKLSDEMRF